jgi:ribulose-phosphate 3-epimerase
MDVFPVINCPDLACVKEKLARLPAFYPPDGFVHLDVTDGVFSTHVTWADAVGWAALGAGFSLEVHLMVKKPEEFIGPWLAAGAKRFIVHVESLTWESAEAIAATCLKHNTEVMLSFNPETPVESGSPYASLFGSFQILAVHPGPGSQTFMPVALEKIPALRMKFPHAIIEIDGGMTPDAALAVKHAGANVVTSDHFIWGSEDPGKAYGELKAI